MKYIYTIFYLLFTLLLGACTENTFLNTPLPDTPDEGDLEPVSLNLQSLPVHVIGEEWEAQPATRVSTDTRESLISNIWVFQYNSTNNQITAPRYYTVSDASNMKIMLRPAQSSKVYILANTNNASWANARDVSTVDKLNSQTLTFSNESAVYGGSNKNLLMVGNITTNIIAGTTNNITISLKRMVAKISFRYTLDPSVSGKLKVTKIALENVPNTIKIGEPTTSPYPSSLTACSYDNITSPQAGSTYTWYVPENLQGVTSSTNEKTKNENAPFNAITIRLYIDSDIDGSSYVYTLYPGENKINNFNIKRNYNYNISLAINSASTDSRVMAAPANCFVMKRNSSIIFDPYDRTETGGGWKYTDYVDKNQTDKSFERVNILWQTGDGANFAIGKNTGGNLVYYNKTDKKVYVKSGNIDGNAVIAGYNAKGAIIWSWHIWVNESAPAQVSNAVLYNTYKWDSNGIYYTQPRVPGRSFMSCNLGATSTQQADIRTFGTYYQWGRKDPFPPIKVPDRTFHPYSSSYIVDTYDQNGTRLSMSSSAGAVGELFRSELIDASKGRIEYALANPTIFLASTKDGPGIWDANLAGETPTHEAGSYINDGDWYWGHDDKLWGGVPFSQASINYQNIVANNGAEKKSLFDPCPSGWMLPPSDAWMGFTLDGMNHNGSDQFQYMNYINEGSEATDLGLLFYMQEFKGGTATSFFPFCGWRNADGSCYVMAGCGGYYTSAASFNNASSIFHIHPYLVHPYDYGYGYSRRSCAYPVRCVRETKD